MALGTWWRGDPLPKLPALPAFTIRTATDTQLIKQLNRLSEEDFNNRLRTGNHAYIAYLQETPVAYGWVGIQGGGVREIQLTFTLPPNNRYLWDFETLPEWRRRGIYAHFLQAIIQQESNLAERFWLLYEPGNDAASHSIQNAGFEFVGELTMTSEHTLGLMLFNKSARAYAGAAILALPIS
jgi:GNAT superfamily N-acetyltransferase